MPEKKVLGWWLTNCQFDLGELSLHENCSLLSPRDVHLSSSFLAKAITHNINITWDMLSPCLTTTLKLMDVYTLQIISLPILLLYMSLIAERSIGGAQYLLVWR